MIQSIFEEAPELRTPGIQIVLDIGADRATAEQHAIVGIGSIHRIAELDQESRVRKEFRNSFCSERISQIVGRFFSNDLLGTGRFEQVPVPIQPAMIFAAEVMGFVLGKEYAFTLFQLPREPGCGGFDGAD